MRIAILGGGIAGSVAALLFSENGHNVSLWEARKYTGNDNYSRTGGIIGISHEAMSVLARFDIMPSDYTMGPSEMKWSRVNRRRVVESNAMPFGGHNTTWTRLHSILRKATRGLRRIDRVTSYTDNVLQFSSGHIARPDIAIWADGIRSLGRRVLSPERQLRYAGYVAFRGLPHGEESNGWRAFSRYATNGKVVGIIGSDWTLYKNMPAVTFRRLFGGEPTNTLFVRELTSNVIAMADRELSFLPLELTLLLRQTPSARRALLPIVDSDIPTKAVYDRGKGIAVLLGDALANVRPHSAMGANLGIIGAQYLAQAIDNYEARLLPRLELQIKRGQRLGRMSGLGFTE